ncbi:hypothetical protein LK542_22115 [Massilia sp. IC2-477]|uniref:hypothetical protein n=1 Tax=Massilia sp. IC2-477 TaxID=2887198 RepID=UPI001D117F29|nr:hypothetical protein [Massilia sp. IC2-477]MCC2958314.1 hypothetical protein [Massilia sp. IC2-477]
MMQRQFAVILCTFICITSAIRNSSAAGASEGGLQISGACSTAGDASVRLGCYQLMLLRKSPGWELYQECARQENSPEQLACFDAITPFKAEGQAQLNPAFCSEVRDSGKRLACFANGYRPLLDQNDVSFCFTVTEDQRLACFDRLHQPNAPADKPKYWKVLVREKGLPKAKTLEEAASVGFVHSKGETHGQVKAAVILRGGGWANGWYPFASADINQDLTASTRSNTKSLGIGAGGALLRYDRTGIGLETVVQAKTKKDSEMHTESAQIVIDNQFVINRLATGAPWAEKGAFKLFPVIGFSVEDWSKVKAGDSKGRATSGYIALEGMAWLPRQRRVQLNAVAQRFLDQSATGGRSKRYENYYSFGLDIYLYDPLKPPKTFTPLIGLKREIGLNPLESSVKLNRTSLLVRFKVDLGPY